MISAYTSYINIKNIGTNTRNKKPHCDSNIDKNVPYFGCDSIAFPAIKSAEYVSPFSYETASSSTYTFPTTPY